MESKAIGKSISFKPSTLHDAAVRYGAGVAQKMNPSEVVCEALTEYFSSRGFKWQAEGAIEAKFQQRAASLRRLEELGVNVDAALTALIAEREGVAAQVAKKEAA